MAVAALSFITEDEYVALEARAEEKHEYFAGRIYAMAGASPDHVQITSNIHVALAAIVRPRGCEVYGSDLRVRVEATGLNTYPDLTVICGKMRRTEQRPQAVTNPTLLVEVLSESTIGYDRGEKWRHYQTIESLTDYVLVWQDRPWVEHYVRQSEDEWTYRLVDGAEAKLRLENLGGELALAEVYRGVTFPENPALHNTAESAPPAQDGT